MKIYIISDTTGQTCENIANTCLSQFKINFELQKFVYIRDIKSLNKILTLIEKPSIVFYTIANKELNDDLQKFCNDNNICYIDVLKKTVEKISLYLNDNNYNYYNENAVFGIQYKNDNIYYDKINSIEWTISHDDGNLIENYNEADIIIFGISRTSKTPTSMYLSIKGYKVANYPLILDNLNINEIENIINKNKNKCIGLIISSERLFDIRTSRIRTKINYNDIEFIEEEVKYFKRFYNQNNIPYIDVSRMSIEEISAMILKKLKLS